jgi:MFS family permease
MRPTNTRRIVVVFAITLAVLQYIDRVAISQAAPLVMKDLALTKEQMSWVFSAFTLAYALFEIPGGYLGDWIGPRKVLLRIVLWWSFFTAATGWAWSLTSLAITRFLFGAGEAGCFPNLSKAFNRWMPAAERSRAQGIMWMSARWGGAITPMLVYGCLTMMTWRQAFLVFGLAGVAWAIVFAWWYRDDPRAHPGVNAAEAALLPPPPSGGDHLHVPWRRMATSRTVWCLCGQYAAMSYAWYFFVTWFPTYLLEVWKFDLKASAALAGLPLLLGGFGSLAAGWLTPPLARRIGIGRARRWLGAGAMAAAAVVIVPPFVMFGMHEYQRNRVLTFLSPESDPSGTGYNIIQSKIALGSGGILGKGYGLGSQSPQEFLPERHTDFIFSTVAEEFGFVGSCFLLLCYVGVIIIALRIVSAGLAG